MSNQQDVSSSSQATLISLLESTGSDIGRLSATCCQPDKSERMQALLRSYKQVSKSTTNTQYAGQLLEFLEATGSVIGGLHVTCCTSDREDIYQRLLKTLNQIFLIAWQLKGVTHE